MFLGWVIVAALEWAAWRGEPHYGSGLPPRYYVPRLNLPPPQPLEQVATGYPEAARDEAPTWIASAALREEMLGEWPVAIPVTESQSKPSDARCRPSGTHGSSQSCRSHRWESSTRRSPSHHPRSRSRTRAGA